MNPDFLVIDLFCGAGGTTTGFSAARIGRNKVAKVIACVNHDTFAISSHRANHKGVLHFTEDIRKLDLRRLIAHVNRMRALFPKAKLVLWASLECTNFSRAKGGQPRDADSRTLAEYLFRYIETLNLDYVMIENVEEFMSWGPLDENGRPISKHAGEDFVRWVDNVKKYGFDYEHRLINSADFGAFTSRTRYFAIFGRHGLPIVWPEPTHAKNPAARSLFAVPLRKWKPVRTVLDLEDVGRCIFEREKPLSEKTLQRIYAGLIKYVAGGKEVFLLKYNSMSQAGKHTPPSIDEPCPVVSAQNRLGLAQAFMVQRRPGNPESKIASMEEPSRTITTTGGNLNLVSFRPAFLVKYFSSHSNKSVNSGAGMNTPAPAIAASRQPATVFIAKYFGNGGQLNSVNDPSPTVTAREGLSVVQAHHWIDSQFGSGDHNHSPVNGPVGSLPAIPKKNLLTAQWLDKHYSGSQNHQSINQPSGSILTKDKYSLTSASFLTNHTYDNTGSSVEQPAPTLLASRRYFYIVNPAWGGNNGSVEDPCCTIVARQDKAPLYITATESGDLVIQVFPTDSEMTIKIKEFMALYGIARITMRMLKVVELKRIMGLSDEYVLMGNQSKQKWMIGNMVHPVVPRAMAKTLSRAIRAQEGRKAA